MIGSHFAAANHLIPLTDVKKFKTHAGQTLLHWSADHGLNDAVKSLIKRGAKVTFDLQMGGTNLLPRNIWLGSRGMHPGKNPFHLKDLVREVDRLLEA